MTADIHRAIVTLAQVLSGVGALLILSDAEPLGITMQTSAWIIFAANVLTMVATAIRANLIPGVVTGAGNEITTEKP